MKHKLLLSGALVICGLFILRSIVSFTDNSFGYYGFIVWNIALATVPLALEPAFVAIRQRLSGITRKIAQIFTAGVWLLFLPNAFYILTDFMHLNSHVLVNMRGDQNHFTVHYTRGDGLYLLDSLLLFTATAYGAYVGGLALYHAYVYLRRRLTSWHASLIMCSIMIMSAVGVYIGRFGRWNSWDGILKPWSVVSDLIDSLAKPATRERFLLVVLTIVLFQVLCIGAIVYAKWYQLKNNKPT